MPWNEELAVAYQILGGIPARQIDLDGIVTKEGDKNFCGTVACGVGWLAMHPRYRERGFKPRLHGACWYCEMPNGEESIGYATVAAEMLGITWDDASELFMPTGYKSEYDPPPGDHRMDHKKLLLARIKNYLYKPTPKMNPENFRR